MDSQPVESTVAPECSTPAGDTGREEAISVTFGSGPALPTERGQSLLAVAEANDIALRSDCRMGICGSDLVRIVAGEENLTPPRRLERATLERLGVSGSCRLACVARVQGPVTAEPVESSSSVEAERMSPQRRLAAVDVLPSRHRPRRLVIVGTGIAGVTAANEMRTLDPIAHITLLGTEPHEPYNRMAIAGLISASVPVSSVYLDPRTWAAGGDVCLHRGVTVTRIDRSQYTVVTDRGETIAYDYLLLATGGQATVPPIDGFGLPGSFTLRSIDDAVQIREYIRQQHCRSAVVVGGGLLGLEIAATVRTVGIDVQVIHRGPWPLHRQLDEGSGLLLQQLLSRRGIHVLCYASPRRALGASRVTGVELENGRVLEADLCLSSTGMQPNVGLAVAAGLAVSRGVVVGDDMCTTDPVIFAAGDVAEHRGRVSGLWTPSEDQARVAVAGMMGHQSCYLAPCLPAVLKVPGIDLVSVGETTAAGPDDIEIHYTSDRRGQYGKLVLSAGRVSGGILIGHPELVDSVLHAVETRLDARPILQRLQNNDWSALTDGAGSHSGFEIAAS